MESHSIDIDEVWRAIGFGKYHLQQYTLWFIQVFLISIHFLTIIFIGYRPPYRCEEVNITSLGLAYDNITHIKYNKCKIEIFKTDVNGTNSTLTMACPNGHTFDQPKYTTFVTEFDLVCDRAYFAELTQSLFMIGLLLGAMCFPQLSDKFGRRLIFQVCATFMFVLNMGQAFAPNILILNVLRFLSGFFCQGTQQTYILFLEMLPMEKRYLLEVIGMCIWVTTITCLGLLGYLFQNLSWRYFQIALTVGLVHAAFVHLGLDESARWLFANGRSNEAFNVIRKASKMNGKNYDEIIKQARLKAKERDQSIKCKTNLSTKHERVKRETNLGFSKSSTNIHNDIYQNNDDASDNDQMNVQSGDHQKVGNDDDNNLKRFAHGAGDHNHIQDRDGLVKAVHDHKMDVHNSDEFHDHSNDVHDAEDHKDVHDGDNSHNTHGCDKDNSPSYNSNKDQKKKVNDSDVTEVIANLSPACESDIQNYTVLTILKDRRILINSLILWFIWITNEFTYFGIFLTSFTLSGNRFVNHILLATVEYPIIIVEYFLMNRCGRKILAMFFHSLTAICLLITTILSSLNDKTDMYGKAILVVTLLGKFGIGGSFSVLWIYTPEMYPTNMRCVGMGTASMVSRFGGIITPFMSNFVEVVPWGPGVIFSTMCFIASASFYFLPETLGHKLPTTIEELKMWHRGTLKLQKVEKKEYVKHM